MRRRNEGASDQAFGQELAERFQSIMRGKLKFGLGAGMPTIDKLAANEASLFHALGTEGVEKDRVVAPQLEVLQTSAVTQGVVSDI